MVWREKGDFLIGEKEVEVRSLRVKDETGKFRRLRVCTVWKPFSSEFTKTPAIGSLVKFKDGNVGVLVRGRNMGYVKVGKNFLIETSIFVPFNFLSKKARNTLLKGTEIVLEEMDEMLIGREKNGD